MKRKLSRRTFIVASALSTWSLLDRSSKANDLKKVKNIIHLNLDTSILQFDTVADIQPYFEGVDDIFFKNNQFHLDYKGLLRYVPEQGIERPRHGEASSFSIVGNGSVVEINIQWTSRDLLKWKNVGATTVLDFRKNEYYFQNELPMFDISDVVQRNKITFCRDTIAYAYDAGRNIKKFPNNEPANTDRGLLIEREYENSINSSNTPVQNHFKLQPGIYTLQVWGSGYVTLDSINGSAREHAHLTFELTKDQFLRVIPQGGIIRHWQITSGKGPVTKSDLSQKDKDLCLFNLGNEASFCVVVDLDLPPAQDNFGITLYENKNNSRALVLQWNLEGEVTVQVDKIVIAKFALSQIPSDCGSRIAINISGDNNILSGIFINGVYTEFSCNIIPRDQHLLSVEDSLGNIAGCYIKKIVVLPYLPHIEVSSLLGDEDTWATPHINGTFSNIKPVDPIIIDLETVRHDQPLPGISQDGLDERHWSQIWPVPNRDVVVIGSRTSVRSVKNIFGSRGQEDGTRPVADGYRLDTDVIRTQGIVWELGGKKYTRSIFHSVASGLRAGIHRDANPLSPRRQSWEWATRNDPHQTRLRWDARHARLGTYDYYIDLVSNNVTGTVEGYHGDAGMQWQAWTTDIKESKIGTVAEYCGHFNCEWSTFFSGYFLPVQYVSDDIEINEKGDLPRKLTISRVHGSMLAKYRNYEKEKNIKAKLSRGNITNAFYHIDLSDGNKFGSYRVYPIELHEFFISPYENLRLIDHIRPLNHSPRQYVDVAKIAKVDVNPISTKKDAVRFPPATKITGHIQTGAPPKPFADPTAEYGPGPWYWPRFEGVLF